MVMVVAAPVIPGAVDAWWRKTLLIIAAALMAWLTWYVNVLSRERREKEALRGELAEQRRRADRAEQQLDDFFPQMLALLKQIAANTAPKDPDRPTSEPDDESVSPDD